MADIAVLGGVGAALCWGVQYALSSRAARRTDPLTALLGVLLVGLATALPFALLEGPPRSADLGDWSYAAGAALGDVCGLGLVFVAFRRGPLALIAPIASAQGATATVLSVLTGEALAVADALGLVLVLTGMVVVLSHERSPGPNRAVRESFLAVLLAMGSCVSIGVALFCLSRSSPDLGSAWTLVVLRAGGIILLGSALAAKGVLAAPRGGMSLILPAGVIDNLGFVSFLTATAAGSVAIPAVLGSQFSVVAALIGVVVFRERLKIRQVTGVALIICGVAVLATQAG